MTQRMTQPTELAIALAVLPKRWENQTWSYADEVRGRLKLLGFDCTTQQVASWLKRMSRADAPWVEVLEGPQNLYRLTHYGLNDIDNRFPGVQTPRKVEPIISWATS